jgi:hypothetical protein
MTKKQLEDLQEVKKTSHRIAGIARKIDEADKEGLRHRIDEYKQNMLKEQIKINGLINSVCQ